MATQEWFLCHVVVFFWMHAQLFLALGRLHVRLFGYMICNSYIEANVDCCLIVFTTCAMVRASLLAPRKWTEAVHFGTLRHAESKPPAHGPTRRDELSAVTHSRPKFRLAMRCRGQSVIHALLPRAHMVATTSSLCLLRVLVVFYVVLMAPLCLLRACAGAGSAGLPQ
jgi:hypothetical protein